MNVMNALSIKQFPVLVLGLFLLAACEKDEVKTVANDGVSGALSASATTVELSRDQLEEDAVVFSYTPTDFGYQAGVIYSLQLALKGTDFATPREFVLENGSLSKTFSGLEFNDLLLSMNLPLEEESDVEVRLKSALSPTVMVYSDVVNVRSKPIPLTSWVYVPGGYQGWDPATADSLVSLTGNGVYTGIITFPADNPEFKVAPAKSWDVSYGDAGDGTFSPTGGNFNAGAEGMMLLTFDLNNSTWTIEPAPVWSIIGNAIPGSDWAVDTDLKFVNDGQGNWTVTLDLTEGFFKFRRNHDWGVNLGGADGTLTEGGADIEITSAGSYTMVMNPDGLTYELIKN